jgi:hypothetical protein
MPGLMLTNKNISSDYLMWLTMLIASSYSIFNIQESIFGITNIIYLNKISDV